MTQDRFAHDDAAYVLGALSPEEHANFEVHLQTCADCTARVRELADLPALLATVPFDDVAGEIVGDVAGDVPDTLLPGLLRRARSEQRRRRWVTGGLAALAAACLLALAVLVWPSGPGASGPHQQAMAALVSSPIHASAAVQDRRWGTEISLDCRYDDSSPVPSTWAYGLTVIGKDGTSHPLGTWTLVGGRDTKFSSGTALRREQIKSIQITAPDGTAILQLTT